MKWMPIDSAPSDASPALMYCAEYDAYGVGELHGTGSLIECRDGSMFLASHWMPLPEPPEGVR
jgi:hypothetical protein